MKWSATGSREGRRAVSSQQAAGDALRTPSAEPPGPGGERTQAQSWADGNFQTRAGAPGRKSVTELLRALF